MTVAFKNKQPIVVSPAALRRAGFKSGQKLEVKVTGGAITILAKAAKSGNDLAVSERRAISRGIAASERDYKAGRSYGPFKTHEAFIASLREESAKMAPKKTKR
jgi:bifunctional DNA-binding transcriptional regulator/antitoxin component of YhaV-PrlF toxin-antitoxin module